jgi:hypothetical protein
MKQVQFTNLINKRGRAEAASVKNESLRAFIGQTNVANRFQKMHPRSDRVVELQSKRSAQTPRVLEVYCGLL